MYDEHSNPNRIAEMLTENINSINNNGKVIVINEINEKAYK